MNKKNARKKTSKIFPLYLMIVDGCEQWLTIQEAGIKYDDGFSHVEIAGTVMTRVDGTQREITDKERRRIAEIADAHSASK